MSYLPQNHNHVSPYLVVKNAQPIKDFLIEVLNGVEILCLEDDTGEINHLEMKVQDSVIMIGQTANADNTFPAMLHIYVEDVDETFENAKQFGLEVIREPSDQYFGDRNGGVKDSQGNIWFFATRKHHYTQEEMQRRFK